MASMYDLIANIPHETTGASTNAGPSGTSKKDQREEGSTVWKVHVRAGAGGGDQEKWFALQDLDVSEVRKEMVFLGETVVQVSISCHSKLLGETRLLIVERSIGLGTEGRGGKGIATRGICIE